MHFQALEIALQLITALRPVIDKVGRSSKKEAEQMQDAANSIARNRQKTSSTPWRSTTGCLR